MSHRPRTRDKIFAEAYDAGYLNGYRGGLEDGWAKGFDAGVEWEAHEKMGVVQ